MRRPPWCGPPQVWQSRAAQWVSDVSPEQRLNLAGEKGLAVGKGSQLTGGLATHIAERLVRHGIAWVERDLKGRPVRAFACQLSFNFWR